MKSLALGFALVAGLTAAGCSTPSLFPPDATSNLVPSEFGVVQAQPDVFKGRVVQMAGRIVGVEESAASIADLARQHVDQDARRGADVLINGETWQSWTDSGGDYAVARSLQSGGRTVESWLVVGTAPEQQIRNFAGTLVGGSLPPTG